MAQQLQKSRQTLQVLLAQQQVVRVTLRWKQMRS
jgi:hypothetical protein